MPKGELFIKHHSGMTLGNNVRYSYNSTTGKFVADNNGVWIDAFLQWGVSFSENGLSSLSAPAPNKKNVENKSRLQNGKQIIKNPSYVKKDERALNIEMHITAPSKEAFWQRYDGFCTDVLDYGFIEIVNGHIPTKVFRMEYNSCSQYSEYMQQLAKFTLRLTEPDPTNRTFTDNTAG